MVLGFKTRSTIGALCGWSTSLTPRGSHSIWLSNFAGFRSSHSIKCLCLGFELVSVPGRVCMRVTLVIQINICVGVLFSVCDWLTV